MPPHLHHPWHGKEVNSLVILVCLSLGVRVWNWQLGCSSAIVSAVYFSQSEYISLREGFVPKSVCPVSEGGKCWGQ